MAIVVNGSEAQDWLNRVLSNKLPNSQKIFGAAILDYKANPKMIFFVETIKENEYRLIFEEVYKEKAWQILEDGIFAEDVKLVFEESIDNRFCVITKAETSEDESALLVQNAFSLSVIDTIPVDTTGYIKLDFTDFQKLRFLIGIPSLDFMENHIIIESDSYLNFVSDDKGCYPGQEVVNKILSIGQVPKKLLVLRSSEPISQADTVSFLESKEVKDFHAFEFQGQFYFASFVRTKLVQEMSNQIRLLVSGKEILCSQIC
ncbi:MAG: hypothetical protein VX642_00410 [Bdellovibrionota bacterium]|nr:hypothetical protein [Bdellovibrionota bacterium]